MPSKSFSRCLWESVTTGHLKSCDLRLFGSIATPRIEIEIQQTFIDEKRKRKRKKKDTRRRDTVVTPSSPPPLQLTSTDTPERYRSSILTVIYMIVCWFIVWQLRISHSNSLFVFICALTFELSDRRSRESLEEKKQKIGDDACNVFSRQDEWRRDGGVRRGRRDSRPFL